MTDTTYTPPTSAFDAATGPELAPPPAPMKIAERLIDLGDQLKGIVATCDERDQLISYILELVNVRTNALGAVWLEQPQKRELQILESRFSNPTFDSKHVQRAILDASQMALADGIPKLVETKQVRGSAVIAAPVFIDDKTMGIFAIFLHHAQQHAKDLLLVAQLISANLDLWRGREHLNRMNFELHSAAAVLELLNQIDGCDTTRQACFTIVNQLQQLVKCEEVAIGLIPKGKLNCKLMALSSRSEFDSFSEITRIYGAAFDEAIVKKGISGFPAQQQAERGIALAQKKLASHLRCPAVITIPLTNADDQPVGAIAFCGELRVLQNTMVQNLFSAMQTPIGTSLGVVKRIEGGPVRRTLRRIRDGKEIKTIWLVAGGIAATVLAMFIPVDYRIGCQCTAQPVERRLSVAPYDGLLENTFVEPGDVVKQGTQLAQMDGREIRIQLASVENDRHAAIKKSDAHRARHEVSDMIIADHEQQRLANESKILRQRESQLSINSPVDGIVLSGSVDRKQNFPVNIGQELFEIAPLSPLKVEINVPADEIMHIESGDTVNIRFDGFGMHSIEGTVHRIRPRSEIRGDQNVFVAEVILENEDRTVRPGMQGSAKIIAKKKSLGWCLFHRPWEKLTHAMGF